MGEYRPSDGQNRRNKLAYGGALWFDMAMLSSPDFDPNLIEGFSNQFLEKYGVSMAVAQNRRANGLLNRQIEETSL
ncbi:hypothetical protein N7495_001026 [Penicillium taxi]|uniref:uncharacterized protein n=1 Tax=Penicillium taxi TaxID=168475 RepID=UPI0025450348|nr:uncharacterized protein N7495_001026 [Penicillium taxi]KAJ5908344.1 hypothetical protein N7495_001026 [Penicillium taxi]